MPNTTAPRPWTRGELEHLIAWMEDNQEQLRGKQVAWHKEVKEQAFTNEDHITVKRITEKMGNIKKAWKDAKGMQTRSGWGVKSEDNEQSINDILERKCPFFWRLEEIWGSRPNVSVILHTESIAPLPSTQEPSSQIPPEPISRIPSEPISRIPTPARNSTPAPPLPHLMPANRNMLWSRLQHGYPVESRLFLTFGAWL